MSHYVKTKNKCIVKGNSNLQMINFTIIEPDSKKYDLTTLPPRNFQKTKLQMKLFFLPVNIQRDTTFSTSKA